MASEKSRLLNRIEGDDDQLTGSVVSRNLTRLCIITSVLMFFFMIATIALAAVLGYTKANEKKQEDHTLITNFTVITNGTFLNNTLCLNEDCVQAAARITKYMDTSVNPCDDFYMYSCGGWEKENVIPEGLGIWGTFEQLAKSNYQFLVKAMSDNTKSPSVAIEKAKQIFAACTNITKIQADFPAALVRYLTLTGGWNEANITENTTWSINSSLVVEHYYGSSAFFSFDIEPDDKNSSKAVIKIAQDGLTLGIPDFYTNETDEFYGLIDTIGEVLTGLVDDPYLIAYDVAEFERTLSESFMTNTELRNVSALYNPMSLGNFTDLVIPQIDWVEYFNTIFEEGTVDHVFTEDDIIIVETHEYFCKLKDLLLDTPEETLQNYAKWHVILHAVQYADGEAAIYDILRTSRFPKSSRLGDDRSMDCVELVEMAMPFALARPFVDNFITETLKMKVNATANAIENAFIERIKEKTWLDDTTKQKCVEKVNAITRQIAYPDFVENNSELDKFYEDLTFEPDADYFAIGYAIGKFQLKQMLSQYGKPIDKMQ